MKIVLGICMLFFGFGNLVKAQVTKQDSIANQNAVGSGRLLTDLIDTTTVLGKEMLAIKTKFGNVNISGYLQPQFQVAQSEGIDSYNGGDFAPFSKSRFRLRRGRLRTDFVHYNDKHQPVVSFVFQFDGTERGVNIRDFWGRFYENKFQLFHFTTGMFARPFGFELIYSSQFRESPERGRMSQILMATERDLGVSVGLQNRKNNKLKWLGMDVGVFNGQGLTGPQELDSRKDIVAKLYARRSAIIPKKIYASGSVSILQGGYVSRTQYIGTTKNQHQILDSAQTNFKKNLPRNYYGADVQFFMPQKNTNTELRIEYITGKQTAAFASSNSLGVYPTFSNGTWQPLYIRNFNGWYIYFLQNIVNRKHQFVFKFDSYDPNTNIKGTSIKADAGFSAADVAYKTWGIGYIFYVSPNFKIVAYYENPINEQTQLIGFRTDRKDATLTLRTQFSF